MKKVFLMIAATLLFASCNKNDEVVKCEQDPIPSSIITLKSTDGETGDICITVKDSLLGTEYDSCFSVGVPFEQISVVVDKIYVKVGEGENEHDSIVYIYDTKKETPKDRFYVSPSRREWVLSSIRCVKINTPQINISTNDYILVFTSDTSFKFNTSVNEAGGSYQRINDQTIYISSYQEKATDNPAPKQIDKLLLEEFRDSMTVECDKNKLVLYNQTSEFVFYLPDWDI